MFSSGGSGGYVAEKAESSTGWLFPVGDEVGELGYVDMFTDMFDAMDTGRAPRETIYDGYVVNAIMDAALKSARTKQWEPVELEWRGGVASSIKRVPEYYEGKTVVKRELLPDGRSKLILNDPQTGEITDVVL